MSHDFKVGEQLIVINNQRIFLAGNYFEQDEIVEVRKVIKNGGIVIGNAKTDKIFSLGGLYVEVQDLKYLEKVQEE